MRKATLLPCALLALSSPAFAAEKAPAKEAAAAAKEAKDAAKDAVKDSKAAAKDAAKESKDAAKDMKGAEAVDARKVLDTMLDLDLWGLDSAETSARVIIKEASGATRELQWQARSRRYAPGLSKALLRFKAPADVAGVGVLLIQKKNGDDERHLFLPEVKKSRRIAGNLRTQSLMGTDFSYADLDRRELREAKTTLIAEETVDGVACYHIDAKSANANAAYERIELWIRKDNSVPVKMAMFNGGKQVKTLVANEIKDIDGKPFVVKATMTDLSTNRSSQLILDKVVQRKDMPDSEFTVRNLEKP